MKPITQLAGERISVRAYDTGRPVPAELRTSLQEAVAASCLGPLGNQVRIELVDVDELATGEARRLGTYGIISGARLYLVTAIEDTASARVDLGYCLEKIILEATRLGLGTCWMGGTFRRANFAQSIEVKDSEIVPVVTPVGHATKQKSLRERVMRRLAGSDQRQPWESMFFLEGRDTPLPRGGRFDTALACLRLAPSASNKQPWRIVEQRGEERFDFHLERTPRYNEMMRGIDLQMVDMGIAMCHFDLAATEAGYKGEFSRHSPAPKLDQTEYIISWQMRPDSDAEVNPDQP
ncbi:MAG: nitroreductase [bacterium]|nr:nitroreductase [bacterium]MCP5065086.1 nitroreductase [bacterium]